MEKQSIVGENGVYIIDEEGISIVSKTEKVKGKTPVPEKLMEAIKQALESKKEKKE